MLTVRLDPAQEALLSKLASDTGRSKSFYVKEALERYLEDRADYLTALAALERNEQTFSAAEIRKTLGV